MKSVLLRKLLPLPLILLPAGCGREAREVNGVDLSSSPYQHPEDQRNCIEFGGKWQQMEGPIRAIVTEPCTCYGLSKKPLTQLSQSDIEYVQAICRPKGWW